MKLIVMTFSILAAGFLLPASQFRQTQALPAELSPDSQFILLPKPQTKGSMSLEEALAKRRSCRQFADQPLTLTQLGQLLWAAQGRTDPRGFRTAPSAGALYPLEVYLVAENVTGLDPGIYHYRITRRTLTLGLGISSKQGLVTESGLRQSPHGLKKIKEGRFRQALQQVCLDQAVIGAAPVNIILAADYARTAKKYGSRAERYVHIETGHVGQNICLQAQTLNLGACTVGAFSDSRLKALLAIAQDPRYVIPVGVPLGKSRD